ncbi:NUDIX domain-containing protein [Pectinatus sottacetonis]|uniref:NUDIX domain-containing protein n=1 Tax=Pectinatus sottacetonis TaxID=1002795 RepID=UPI0018C59E64|nr:NUDIX hydrolase [Pectinatus sottacetonis]
MYEDLIEKKISSTAVFTGNLLHVKKDTVELPNGSTAYREWIKHPGASAIIPYTASGDIIMVRQYRYPVQQVTLEIPAGKLDLNGENPLDCAKRELSEETGYKAEKYTKLLILATTVGFSNEYIHIYLAEKLTAGKMHPDEDEFINLVKIPLSKAVKMIYNGEIIDAKSISAILLVDKIKHAE